MISIREVIKNNSVLFVPSDKFYEVLDYLSDGDLFPNRTFDKKDYVLNDAFHFDKGNKNFYTTSTVPTDYTSYEYENIIEFQQINFDVL